MAFSWFHPLSIDHNQVPSNQSNFPVLVNFTDSNFATVPNGGKVQNSSGFDIGFYADNNAATKLSWEMERYTATSGEVVAWVKLPTVSSTAPNTTFYVFYDDSTISTDQSNPTDVWSNNYLNVYHLKDGSTLSVADSLVNANGTNHGATATTGQVDGGAGFVSASSQYIDIARGVTVSLPALTWEAWVNATSFPNAYNTIVGFSNALPLFSIMYVKSTGKLALYQSATATVDYDGTGTNTLSVSTWYHIVMTYDSTNGLIGYLNGSQDGTAGANGNGQNFSASSGCDIGQDAHNAGRFWNGSLDEIRLSTVARSADWITATYNSHKPSSTFIGKGGQQAVSLFPAFLYGWS